MSEKNPNNKERPNASERPTRDKVSEDTARRLGSIAMNGSKKK